MVNVPTIEEFNSLEDRVEVLEVTETGKPPTEPDQPPPSSGGTAWNPRYIIATPDAPDDIRAVADLDLSRSSNISSDLSAALNLNHFTFITGPTLNLNGPVNVTNTVDILSNGTLITIPETLDAPSSSRPAGFKIQGSRSDLTGWTLPSKLEQGSITLPFSRLPSQTLKEGDWIQLKTSGQVNNPNRPGEYVKGELQRVLQVNGNTVTLAGSLRDDYTVDSSFLLYKLNVLKNVVIDGFNIRAHPDASGQQEVFAIQDVDGLVIRNLNASGPAGYYGLGVFRSVNILIEHVTVERVYDALTSSNRNGYGLHMSGVENVTIRDIIGRHNRHAIDFGQFSTSYPVPRHIVIDRGLFYGGYAAALGTHNAQDLQIKNVTVEGSNGGIHIRGGDVTIEGFRFYGATYRIPPDVPGWTSPEIGGAIFVGEESSKEGDNRVGPAGTRLTIKDTIIDTYYTSSGPQAFHGIRIVDPLEDSFIEAYVAPVGQALWADGDYIRNSVIDLVVDGVNATSNYGGVVLVPKSTSGTNQQFVSSNHIRINSHNQPTAALTIGGGQNGGVSEGNIIDLTVSKLGKSQSSSTPQLVFSGGSHGKQFISSIVTPYTNESSSITEGSATVVLGTIKDFA